MVKFRSHGNKIQNCHGEATSQPQQQKLVHSKIRINQNNSRSHNENYTKRREDKRIKKELYVDRESQLLTNSNSASVLFTLIQASDSSPVVKNSPFFRAPVVLPPSFLQNLFVSLKQGSPQGSFFLDLRLDAPFSPFSVPFLENPETRKLQPFLLDFFRHHD